MINCHIHTFIVLDNPEDFLPFKLIKWLARRKNNFGKWLAVHLTWGNTRILVKRYIRFIDIGKLENQRLILEECKKSYPAGTMFAVLPMDMAFMAAGEVPRPYKEQILELADLADIDKTIIPFVHIDPRRAEYIDIFNMAMQRGFKGLKIYPPLGYFPYDLKLDEIYKYCQENNIPVIAHCTPGNPVHWRGSKKDLFKMLEPCKFPIIGKSKAELCANFTDPRGWEIVMNKFPKLKVCCAHYGSGREWDDILKDLMRRYENFYVDCSFTMYNPEFWPAMKVLLRTDEEINGSILFGSDYYMVAVECEEKQFSINMRADFGEDLWDQITVRNPARFLNG
jgi:predicted TIM-barrel fold metal-dependent hydrolase